jgi:hypothetical protein
VSYQNIPAQAAGAKDAESMAIGYLFRRKEMSKEITTHEKSAIMESVVIAGDLAKLSAGERVNYYNAVCQSIGVNPLTKPFDYIRLNNRLTLYAKKDCTDQLRQLHNISIDPPTTEIVNGVYVVTITAHTTEGRTDTEIGAVYIENLKGDKLANSLMKAITKAKRRVTLSICGLGFLDETEIETIPNAQIVDITEDGDLEPLGKKKAKASAKKKNGNGQIAPVVQALVDEKIAQNPANAAAILNHLKLKSPTVEEVVTVGKLYRAWRDSGMASPKQAAKHAVAGEMPK